MPEIAEVFMSGYSLYNNKRSELPKSMTTRLLIWLHGIFGLFFSHGSSLIFLGKFVKTAKLSHLVPMETRETNYSQTSGNYNKLPCKLRGYRKNKIPAS